MSKHKRRIARARKRTERSSGQQSHSALRDEIWAVMADRSCSFGMTYDEALESVKRTPSITGKVIVLDEVARRAEHVKGLPFQGEGNR
jgi:hypothetical protein